MSFNPANNPARQISSAWFYKKRKLKLRDGIGFPRKQSPRQTFLLTLYWVGSTSPGKHGWGGREVGRVGKEAGPRWHITELPTHHKEAQLLAPPHKGSRRSCIWPLHVGSTAGGLLSGFFWSPVSYCSKPTPWGVNSSILPHYVIQPL